MYLEIKTIKKQDNKYWNDLLITKIWLYDSDGKRTKRIKLNDVAIEELLEAKIDISLYLPNTND